MPCRCCGRQRSEFRRCSRREGDARRCVVGSPDAAKRNPGWRRYPRDLPRIAALRPSSGPLALSALRALRRLRRRSVTCCRCSPDAAKRNPGGRNPLRRRFALRLYSRETIRGGAMHLGYFGLMGYRERGKSPHEVFREHIEQVIAADRLGFEIAWFAEHHFSNYCICPSPLIMAARCAGVTKRIRLGSAVVVTPLYDPARLLAEIGMVDCLCDGRLVLGVGSGYQPYEFERFGKDLAHAREMLDEFLDMLRLAFEAETFTYEGKHYHLPTTHISARPMKGPPEIWLAGDHEFGHRLCARRGYVPMFTGRWNGADYQREMRARIASAYVAEGRDPQRMPLAVQRFMCVTTSRQETMDYVDNARHQMRLANALRRRAEVMDGGMMREVPIPNEIS